MPIPTTPALLLVAGAALFSGPLQEARPGERPPGQRDGAPPPRPPEQGPEEPEEERGLRLTTEDATPGYTLVTPLNSEDVYLVDLEGSVVHTWRTAHAPGNSVYLLANGNLLRCAREEDNPRFRGGGIGGRVQEIAWDGTVVWDYVLADEQHTLHHDIEPLPNGNVLMIAWEYHSSEEAAAVGRDSDAIGDDGFWTDVVIEVRPTRPVGGEVVWEWRSWDHLIQDRDREKSGYGAIPDHPGRIDVNADHRDRPPLTAAELRVLEETERQMRALGYVGGDEEEEDEAEPDERAERRKRRPDWLHTNSVAYHAELDLIALSTPNLAEIWVIDHSTTTAQATQSRGGRWGRGGELLWRWGNPRTYGAGTEEDRRLWYQHDASWIDGEGGALGLLVFNNAHPDGFSSVDELVLPFDRERGFRRALGEPCGPAEPTWSYRDPGNFHSAFISGAERLANGNTLICSGAPGRVFEVTPAGRIVWDWLSPLGGEVEPTEQAGRAPAKALFRATRIAPDHPGLAGRL